MLALNRKVKKKVKPNEKPKAGKKGWEKQLQGGRFRALNEAFYTESSEATEARLQSQKELNIANTVSFFEK